jgi:modification methylase
MRGSAPPTGLLPNSRVPNDGKPAHRILLKDSRFLTKEDIPDESVHLVVTSPPYPMIQQWDELFWSRGFKTFQEAHDFLEGAWEQCHRVLVDGGLACINIGDATRSVPNDHNGFGAPKKVFKLFPNHVEVTQRLESIGFQTLPYILWKKPTTRAKYKGKSVFLGSGFLPTNAYVTIDVEYILIFRKGGPRKFDPKDETRYDSKFTKEERDKWFSQIWSDINGTRQTIGDSVRRIAAFPEEIPRRLIRMFSVKGDTVFDPFLGSGTTMKVAAELGRRSIGVESDDSLLPVIMGKIGAYDSDSLVQRQGILLPEILHGVSAQMPSRPVIGSP